MRRQVAAVHVRPDIVRIPTLRLERMSRCTTASIPWPGSASRAASCRAGDATPTAPSRPVPGPQQIPHLPAGQRPGSLRMLVLHQTLPDFPVGGVRDHGQRETLNLTDL